VQTPCFGYFIPLRHTLERIIRNPGFLYFIANPQVSNDGILRDDIDGLNTRLHPIFQLAPDALRIRLYFDDVELTDPISSYSCKIGVFYFTIQNVPQKFRAKVDNIFLIGIVRHDHLRQFGAEGILANFLDVMDDLGQGQFPVQITPNFAHNFFGFLAGLAGDTPAVHWILGFKEGVGQALRACRECFGTILERQQFVSTFPILKRKTSTLPLVLTVPRKPIRHEGSAAPSAARHSASAATRCRL